MVPSVNSSDDWIKAQNYFWEAIKNSNDLNLYESYLKQFPDGIYAALAKERIQRIKIADNEGKRNKKSVNQKKNLTNQLDQNPLKSDLPVVIGREFHHHEIKS